MKQWFSISILFLILGLSASAKSIGADARLAPNFDLPAQAGNVSMDSLRGKVVLVDFWASWCVPCRQSFPWMSQLHEAYSSKGLVIVAINLDKDRELADRFLAEFSPPFTVAFDPSGKSAKAFEVSAMPFSYIVSRSGTILSAHAGFDSKKTGEMENLIKEALSQ